MHHNEIVPSWVPSMLHLFLPGGRCWEVDQAAGHPRLAARLSRFAPGPFDRHDRCGAGFHSHRMPLREDTMRGPAAILGQLELRVSDSVEFILHEFDLQIVEGPKPDVALASHSWRLPIAHPEAFERLLVELTQQLEALPSEDFDGPSWGPAFLRPVLPGGYLWPEDAAAGHHPILAARIGRLAVDWLGDEGTWWEAGDRHWISSLQLDDGFALEIHRITREPSTGIETPREVIEFKLSQIRGGVVVRCDPDARAPRDSDLPTAKLMLARDELELSIADPLGFWHLVRELTRYIPPRF